MAGFRTGIQQSLFPRLCKGASLKIQVPRDYEINALNNYIYPEFFINMNTVDGSCSFDGGIIYKEHKWIAFIYGGDTYKKIWVEADITDKIGKKVDLKFKGEVVEGEHSLCLYVDNKRVLTINRHTQNLGLIAEQASRSGIWRLSYELNLVPTKEAGTNYIINSNNKGRAYFKNASFAYAYPIDINDILIAGYKYEVMKNCDNNEYPKEVIEKVCDISSVGDSYMMSSIDFRNY